MIQASAVRVDSANAEVGVGEPVWLGETGWIVSVDEHLLI